MRSSIEAQGGCRGGRGSVGARKKRKTRGGRKGYSAFGRVSEEDVEGSGRRILGGEKVETEGQWYPFGGDLRRSGTLLELVDRMGLFRGGGGPSGGPGPSPGRGANRTAGSDGALKGTMASCLGTTERVEEGKARGRRMGSARTRGLVTTPSAVVPFIRGGGASKPAGISIGTSADSLGRASPPSASKVP